MSSLNQSVVQAFTIRGLANRQGFYNEKSALAGVYNVICDETPALSGFLIVLPIPWP